MKKTAAIRKLTSATALLGAGMVAACAQAPVQPAVTKEQVQAFVADYPPSLQRLYAQVPLQGARNLALNHMRAGLAAMDDGQLEIASRSFDEVLRIIETIYAENAQAEQARSVWYREAAKDFKGEPYERAMAYYYRGLLYLMQGDYQNARASFRGGLLQDTFMEDNQRMQPDFGGLAFLEGWAGRCAALDRATVEASFKEARERSAMLAEPPAGNHLLVLFESGSAPIKSTAGQYREVLRYSPGAVPPLLQARAEYGGASTTAVPAEDLYFQAASRSGRMVDQVNAGKVEYKVTTQTAGRVATAAGAGLAAAGAMSGNRNAGYAGLAVMAVGLMARAAANAMQTEADARQWDNLPGNILVGSFPLRTAGRGNQQSLDVRVTFERGSLTDHRTLPVRIAGPCAIAWGREIPANTVSDIAPKSDVSVR